MYKNLDRQCLLTLAEIEPRGIITIILAGGNGERMKPLLLTGDKSIVEYQMRQIAPYSQKIVITQQKHSRMFHRALGINMQIHQ